MFCLVLVKNSSEETCFLPPEQRCLVPRLRGPQRCALSDPPASQSSRQFPERQEPCKTPKDTHYITLPDTHRHLDRRSLRTPVHPLTPPTHTTTTPHNHPYRPDRTSLIALLSF